MYLLAKQKHEHYSWHYFCGVFLCHVVGKTVYEISKTVLQQDLNVQQQYIYLTKHIYMPIIYPSLFWFVQLISKGCAAGEEPLLDGANPVPDSYFTASSTYGGGSWLAHYARMSAIDAWEPAPADRDAIPPSSFLQVSGEDAYYFIYVGYFMEFTFTISITRSSAVYIKYFRWSRDDLNWNHLLP